jgi:8-oxo-dGTP diphosphatase
MLVPHALAAFTVTLLFNGDSCLLLERSRDRARFPGLWTGIGGRVEPHELADLATAARRELVEETDLPPEAVPPLVLRRAVLQHRPESPELTLLLYFTGELPQRLLLPPSREGTFHWVEAGKLPQLRLIDNARIVLPLLVADRARDPAGNGPVRLGVARCDPDGTIVEIVWH